MQQPSPAPANPLTEIAAFVIAALLIVAGALLLFAQRIDFAGATSIFVLAVGILATNLALKAPSPAQQAQIQGLVTQVMQVIPAALAHAQQPTPIVIHNNLPPAPIPPSATVQSALQALASPAPSATSTPFSPMPPITSMTAAAQPAPVQITPNNPMGTATWNAVINQPLAPLPGGVAQQPFPERFTANPPAISG